MKNELTANARLFAIIVLTQSTLFAADNASKPVAWQATVVERRND